MTTERACPLGLTRQEQELALGDQLAEFDQWMRGQTGAICDGQQYSHETASYWPTACYDNPHGFVVYAWDVERFLSYKKTGVEVWD